MIRSFMFFCLIILCAANSLIAQPEKDYVERLAYFAELIVQGRVQSMHVDSIQLFPIPIRKHWITDLHLHIEKVWAGYYDGDSIVASVLGGKIPGKGWEMPVVHPTEFNLGDTVLVLLRFRQKFGRYMTYANGEFRLAKGKVIFGDFPIFENNGVFWDLIQRGIEARSIESLFRQSDAVVEGRPVKSEDQETVFIVDRAYKGNEAGDTITVSMKGPPDFTRGQEVRWLFYGPQGFDLDSTYVLFLKARRRGYFPFAGLNGVLQRAGGTISSNGRQTKAKWGDLEVILKRCAAE
jgi:hypothetical protein